MKLIFYIFYFVFINTFLVQAYIDPGTGSMLFAVLTGIISTLFFAGKSIVLKLQTLPFWYKKTGEQSVKDRKEFVFYSEGKQYWNIFKPIIDEFIKRQIQCYYYTSDDTDPGLEYGSEFVISVFIGKGNKAYSRLNILEADICLMTTPGLDVYQLERSKGVKHYSHILHAADDAVFYKLFGLDYFDSVLLSGDYQKDGIRELEKKRGLKSKDLFVVGCPYLDVLSTKIETLDIKKNKVAKTVLVSPSWGENALLKKYGLKLLLPLANSDLNIIIRPHPQSLISEKAVIDNIRDNLSAYKNVEWDLSRENITAMVRSDIMISDFSGILLDYLFLLSRPVIYSKQKFDKRPYDLSDIDGEAWKFKMLDDVGIELKEENFNILYNTIIESLKSDILVKKINDYKNTAWFYQGMAGIKCADALQAIHSGLNK